jgi:hemolysin activation/secretion protein
MTVNYFVTVAFSGAFGVRNNLIGSILVKKPECFILPEFLVLVDKREKQEHILNKTTKTTTFFSTVFFIMASLSIARVYAATSALPANVNPGSLSPAPSELIQQQKDTPDRNFPDETTPTDNLPTVELKLPEGPDNGLDEINEPIFQIRIVGSSVFTQEDLAPLVNKLNDHTITKDDLVTLLNTIDKKYYEKGYLTTKTIVDDVEKGVATIRVVEGTVEAVSFSGNRFTRNRTLKKDLGLDSGSLLNVPALQARIQQINEDQDLYRAKANLVAGNAPGQTQVEFQIEERLPFQLSAFSDNRGRPLIGSTRWGFGYQYDSPLGLGDTLSGQYFQANGTNVSETTYSFPVGKYGTSVGLSYGFAHVQVDNRSGSARLDGRANNYGVLLSQPIGSSGIFSFDIGGNIRKITAFTVRKKSGESDVTSLQVGFNINKDDRFGNTAFRAQSTFGFDLFGGDGQFYKQELSLSRVINLPHRNYLLFNAYSMLSPDSLPGYEQMQIGGSQSVRGFSEGLLFGDRGYTFNVEHRWPVPGLKYACPWLDKRVQGASFFDIGQVWLDNSTAGGLPPGRNLAKNSLLSGAGVGIRAAFTQYFEGFADVGFGFMKRSQEPNATPTARLHFGVRSNLIPKEYRARR